MKYSRLEHDVFLFSENKKICEYKIKHHAFETYYIRSAPSRGIWHIESEIIFFVENMDLWGGVAS